MNNTVDLWSEIQGVKHPNDVIVPINLNVRRLTLDNDTKHSFIVSISLGHFEGLFTQQELDERNFENSKSFTIKSGETIDLALNKRSTFPFQYISLFSSTTKQLLNIPMRVDTTFNTAVIRYNPSMDRAWLQPFNNLSFRF